MAVVAETFADAQRGLQALHVEWNDEHAERRSSEELLREHHRLVESGEKAVVARADGDVDRRFLRGDARRRRVLRAARISRTRPWNPTTPSAA